MVDDITNTVLLEHMQAMKSELLQRISTIEHDIKQIGQNMKQGFEDAHKDRGAPREDLEETMRVQGVHAEKLARV